MHKGCNTPRSAPHLDIVATQQARARKTRHHIAKAADLGDGRHLRGHVHHMQLPCVPHALRAIRWAPCMHAWLMGAVLTVLCY